MTAIIGYNDPIFVQLKHTWDDTGTNYIDNRSQWFNVSALTLTGLGGSVATSLWNIDQGPNTLAANMIERRAFCLKGEVSFTFTGTTLVVRVNTDYGWNNSSPILIDGVAPSTLGLRSSIDTVSCDSATYGLGGPAYVDVLIADGLSAGSHTVTISPSTTNANFYFSLAGFKVLGLSSLGMPIPKITLTPAINKAAYNLLDVSLVLKNGKTVQNPTLTFPTGAMVDTALAALPSITAASVTNTTPVEHQMYPEFTGNEISGVVTVAATLSGLYPDPTGTVVQSTTTTMLVGDAALTVVGASWSNDTSTPNGSMRIFTNVYGTGTYLKFTFEGDALTLTVEQDYGYDDMNIYASDNATLLNSITCFAQSTQLFTATLTGFGTGTHTVYLRKKTNNAGYIIFVSASWSASTNFSLVTETVDFQMQASQPVSFPVTGMVIGSHNLTFAQPSASTADYSTYPVKSNAGISYTEVLARFPTFAVCYQKGYADVLAGYDVLIVDPFAASPADVAGWQALGIKVFGYISLGEEDSFYSNRYDFLSANAPYVGNGTGPGGKAGYFMKGGYGAREVVECQNDNQALGTKTCALSRPEYYQAVGRCSASCTNDSVNGYAAWQSGGTCAAGFTRNNNWIRPNANTACTNGACPSFHPVHQVQTGTKCPAYSEATSAYLQDFSIATPNAPDENGIWNSWYANPAATSGWLDRIKAYYAPTVIGGPVVVPNETVVVKSATIGTGTVLVFDTAQFPIDDTATITLTNVGATVIYAINVDFSFDMKTGAFVFNAGIATPPTVGESLVISYTRKGHRMDGIFMDTIDDADVYPQSGSLMSQMIIDLKTHVGANVMLLSNRGFSNLDNYIHTCHGVMFESWLTDYNSATGTYYKITDTGSIAYNEQVNQQLMTLRARNMFDVYSLNYCDAGSTGDALRTYCRQEDAKRGYLSWSSTIDLNVPAPNVEVPTPGLKISTNAFQRILIKGA